MYINQEKIVSDSLTFSNAGQQKKTPQKETKKQIITKQHARKKTTTRFAEKTKRKNNRREKMQQRSLFTHTIANGEEESRQKSLSFFKSICH